MTRVAVLGASGTGKSTLASALAERLGVPAFDADDYYHLPTDPPYQRQRAPEERRALLERDLSQQPGWVLSGGALLWQPPPRIAPTLLVFLHVPDEARIARLVRRERARFGARLDPGGDMEATHREFLEWTRGYEDGTAEGTSTRPLHEAYLSSATCPVLRIEGDVAADDALHRVLAAL